MCLLLFYVVVLKAAIHNALVKTNEIIPQVQ